MQLKKFEISFNEISQKFVVHHVGDDTHCPMGIGKTKSEAFLNALHFLENFEEDFIIFFN